MHKVETNYWRIHARYAKPEKIKKSLGLKNQEKTRNNEMKQFYKIFFWRYLIYVLTNSGSTDF